jgi:hypothetical protein
MQVVGAIKAIADFRISRLHAASSPLTGLTSVSNLSQHQGIRDAQDAGEFKIQSGFAARRHG